MPTVRDGAHGVAIAWPSWGVWRRGHREPGRVWLRPHGRRGVLPHTDWCVTCSGKGRIFADARNGEGLIPIELCESCAGTGRTPRPMAA